MVELATRVRQLEDKAAIGELIASYGLLADRGAATAIANLWIETGEYSVEGYGTAKGREAIAALIESETHSHLLAGGCAHVLSPHVIKLNGDCATANGYSVVFRKGIDAFNAWRVSANLWKLLRTEAGWRVQSRTNAPLDGSAAARALLETNHGA